jgi:anti-anti-sigma factor
MNFHDDSLRREEVIALYLLRRLDPVTTEEFESHYLMCDECFEELGAADLLGKSLRQFRLYRRTIGEVTLLGFTNAAELTSGSRDLEELTRNVLEQKDSKVVIDLSRISRIDSTALGQLLRMHAHLIGSRGALKVLNPSDKVERLMKLTHIDSVIETYPDEYAAVQSFANAS